MTTHLSPEPESVADHSTTEPQDSVRIDPKTQRLVERWHLHCGTIQYFIVGPGATAMHRCSEPVYEGFRPTMTAEESAIAKRAIAILTRRHAWDLAAGVPEIKQALAEAAGTARPLPEQEPDGTPAAVPQRPCTPAAKALLQSRVVGVDPDVATCILLTVAKVAGISVAEITETPKHHPSGMPFDQIRRATHARYLAIAAIYDAHPGIQQKTVALYLGREFSAISAALLRHRHLLGTKSYAAQYTALKAALAPVPA